VNGRKAKEARREARARVLGANTDVRVVHDSADDVLQQHLVEHPHAAVAILNPAILPMQLVRDGLGEGHHLVQIAVETHGYQGEPEHTLVQTSLRALAAAVARMVEEVGAGDDIELPFLLDLFQQCRDEIDADGSSGSNE
jgi:hypothetical protein